MYHVNNYGDLVENEDFSKDEGFFLMHMKQPTALRVME